jgi:hypothetical protein
VGAQGALVHKPGEGTTGWQVMVELCVCGLHRRCIQLLPYSTEWTVLAGLASDVNVGVFLTNVLAHPRPRRISLSPSRFWSCVALDKEPVGLWAYWWRSTLMKRLVQVRRASVRSVQWYGAPFAQVEYAVNALALAVRSAQDVLSNGVSPAILQL